MHLYLGSTSQTRPAANKFYPKSVCLEAMFVHIFHTCRDFLVSYKTTYNKLITQIKHSFNTFWGSLAITIDPN